MHVLMCVGMVQRQPSGSKCSELRADLRRKLAAHARSKEIRDTQAKLVGGKLPVRVDQIGDLVAR